MKLAEIIKQLADTSSTKAKSAILEQYKDRVDLKAYFKATLDPFLNFYIRVKDLPEPNGQNWVLDKITIDTVVDQLNGRIVTGNAARQFVNDTLVSLTAEDQILLKNMINRDPNCNVSFGLVDKCWKNMIPEFPCMLADKYNEKTRAFIKEGPDQIIVQKKEDGGRVAICVSNEGVVTVYSRNGNILETHGVFDAMFGKYPGQVFDGELLVFDDNGVQDRKTGNGIFNKAVRGTISKEEAIKFHVGLWDLVPHDKWVTGYDDTPYKKRLADLIEISKTFVPGRASIVETEVVSTFAEVEAFYLKMLEQGFEGAMVKIANMPWENRRSKYVLKLKEVKDATLRCFAVKPHSKNPDLIGSLECMTSDGLLEVSIGSGLSKEDRERDPSYFVDKLIDMQYNMLIDSKNSDKKSMFLPRYRSIRLDQNVADALAKLED